VLNLQDEYLQLQPRTKGSNSLGRRQFGQSQTFIRTFNTKYFLSPHTLWRITGRLCDYIGLSNFDSMTGTDFGHCVDFPLSVVSSLLLKAVPVFDHNSMPLLCSPTLYRFQLALGNLQTYLRLERRGRNRIIDDRASRFSPWVLVVLGELLCLGGERAIAGACSGGGSTDAVLRLPILAISSGPFRKALDDRIVA
jgi:hypothetical protein